MSIDAYFDGKKVTERWVIRTKKQIDQMARGKILKVVANTPDATQNIDAWTKKSGDKILAVENQGNTSIIYLKKN